MSTESTIPLSDMILQMTESATLKMAALGRQLAAEGHDVISLSLGEPDFDTPEHIKQAAKEALDAGYTKYTPVAGLPELRKAISEKFKRDNDLDYAPDQIVVSNGAKQCIANISLSLFNPGDEVIILAPYWVSYFDIIKLSGAKPVPLTSTIEEDYKVPAHRIEAAITERTKAILFSSPCNPTGSVYTREELEAIAKVVAAHEHIYIMSDEIYEHINFTNQHASIGSIDLVKDRTITINGFSKGFAMTGWRLGYMGAPKPIAAACSKMQGQFTSGANAFGQKAAVTALTADMGPTREMEKAFLRRRDMVVAMLDEIPGVQVNLPMGAFYIFPNISDFFGKSNGEITIKNSNDLAEYILHNAYVATVAGAAFGAPNCLRLSYAASEEQLKEALRRIAKVLGELN